MHRIKLSLSILVVFLVFFLVENITFAESEWGPRTDINPNHDWVITFNDKVDSTTVKENNIYVKHNNVKVDDIKIYINEDKQSITVKAPKDGYILSNTYFLYIEDKIQSVNGLKLNKPVEMQFIISNSENITKTKEEIIAKWNQYKPTFEGNPFIEVPNISDPYSIGSLEPEFLNDGLKMTNFIRYLSDLPDDLVLSRDLNRQAQYGAVVTAANGRLSHYPVKPRNMDKEFFEIGYESTSSSNLSQQYTKKDFTSSYEVENAIQMGTLEGTVYSYMMDEDSTNIDRVGHRRWILNPSLKNIGFGFAINKNLNDYYYYTFSPMQVFDKSRSESVDFDFIGWPSKGYFPNEFFKNDVPWSVSLNPEKYQEPNLNEVEVELTRLADGEKWILNSKDNILKSEGRDVVGEYFNVNNQWFGIPYCIIFRPDSDLVEEYFGKYEIKIKGLKDNRGTNTSIIYIVEFFEMLN